ncbi:nucleolar protein,Nop52-domain-containing protein [Phycomyces blakesleeanus]|uniref:Nucleolar protein,Nop52-domain-containing protein n=1 Tax=Phycomyces blakesleeanus TaxID=4837 RepID=A0ABR3B1B4_PHYBL
MSDKPLVQQALANDLGSLVLEMPASNAIPFLSAFWEVHCKEWYGLDRLRLDKFYLLFRRVIFFSFKFLAKEDWDEELVADYTNMLLEGPLHPTDRTKPDSIRYHIMDIYFGELVKVLDEIRESMDEDDVLELPLDELERPIRVTATDNINKVARTKALEAIRQHEEQDDEDEDDEEEFAGFEASDEDMEDLEEGSEDEEAPEK